MIEIELNNIIKNYGLKNVLNGMNLTLKTGERAALIGCNGAGKSTVFKIIMKQENISAGTINIRKNATIGMLKQIYEYEEKNPNVYTFLQRSFEHFFELETKLKKLENEMSYEKSDEKMSELLQKYGNVQQKYIQMGGYDIQEKFNKICSGLQINEKMLNQNYNDLSGGEKTIVNLGALLLKEPSILLLDEPTNHLDMEKLEWLEKFLGDALPYLLFYFSLLGNLDGDINSIVYMIDSLVTFNTAKKQLDEKIGKLNELNVVKDFNEIELKKCRFKYNKNSVPITIPNFKIKKGEKISITGESGQGKTTAMNILSGLYDLTEGVLLIDGKEVKNTRLDLVFVSQEVDLFDTTIRENLCLGKDIKESKILELFEDAGLTEWFLNLENGLETVVGEKGVKLSAGQKQRLNLIRGILIDKDLYFFDEPTSNLDSVSEEKITNMIEKYLSDKTYVIVTHRPRLTGLCNKHYRFENHIMSEALYNAKK